MPLFAAGLAGTVLLISFQALRLWTYDLRTPLSYSEGDTVIMLLYIKGLLQDGWPTIITHLSAPFFYPGAAFPMLTSVDWVLIKALSAFTTEPGYLLNGFWLLTLVLSAWTAAYASYQLRIAPALAFACGLLYAFLPFALLRSVHHLNLVYYVVPLLCLLAILIAGRGEGVLLEKQAARVGLLACVVQGFNYVYYSYFAVLLFVVAAIIGYRRGGARSLKLAAGAIALVSVSTALNLAPALKTWQAQGKPPEMGYKSVAEAEIYGAKLRQMISPHTENRVPPLGKIAQKAAGANFPLENENATARLGLFGAFGLLVIILSLLRRGVGAEVQQPAGTVSSLGLATLLMITIGGFGAVINLLTVADIRAYNRFSVYLSFFAIAAAAFCLQDGWAKAGRWLRLPFTFLVSAFVALSLYDQLLDKKGLVSRQQTDTLRMSEERSAVEKLEQTLPAGALVLELPLTGFPPISHFHQMISYDLGRPYIWSSTLKWSWPSFSQRHRDWQTKIQTLKGQDLIRAAALSGFSAVWIDRAAYTDGGAELIESLSSERVKHVDVGSGRVAVLDIRETAANLKASMGEAEFERRSEALLGSPIIVDWKNGFHTQESTPEGRPFRWVRNKAELLLRNTGNSATDACIRFAIGTPREGKVYIEGGDTPVMVQASSAPQVVRIPVNLQSAAVKRLRMTTDLPRHNAPGDPRELFFYILDFEVATDGAMDHREDFCSK